MCSWVSNTSQVGVVWILHLFSITNIIWFAGITEEFYKLDLHIETREDDDDDDDWELVDLHIDTAVLWDIVILGLDYIQFNPFGVMKFCEWFVNAWER